MRATTRNREEKNGNIFLSATWYLEYEKEYNAFPPPEYLSQTRHELWAENLAIGLPYSSVNFYPGYKGRKMK